MRDIETLASGPIQLELGAWGATLISLPDSVDVVLIIPGSGPTNRDGNNPVGVTAQPYNLLAEGLARKVIASVRIDKRGIFASSQSMSIPML